MEVVDLELHQDQLQELEQVQLLEEFPLTLVLLKQSEDVEDVVPLEQLLAELSSLHHAATDHPVEQLLLHHQHLQHHQLPIS
jgi:hypothetical protein